MKYNKLFYTALIGLSLYSTGCKKFLERPPEGQKTADEAFVDEQGLLNFTNGIYTLTGDAEFKGGRLTVLNELLGDHYKGDKFTGDYAEIYKRQNTFFGDIRNNFYIKAYSIVSRANIALSRLSIATTQKNWVEGQAKFFRGMANFELVRMMAQPYGYNAENSQPGIPLRTTVTLDSKDRSSVADVYAQIIADFKSADFLLPATSADAKYYTATKLAAKAYLAKVYFQMNNFAQAYAYSDSVIASNQFKLDTNFTYRFSEGLSKEGIWVIPNQTNSYEVGGELRTNFRSVVSIPGFVFTDGFYSYATAKATDKRKVWYSNTLQAGANVLTKYNAPYFNVPVLHLTEIKLIHAESGAELGGATLTKAITDINEILTRAYGALSNLPATATATGVITTTRTERELELVGEGSRTQEIKRIGARTGVNVDRRGSPWNCNGFILQFPKGEQDANAAFLMNPEGNCF